ncbi:tetratricopeptide repeat protein, partial [bacterium]|nr:tetratricopeptide repeat protein [bacterium]
LFDLGRYEEALPYLKRCAELDPHGYTQGYDALTLSGETYIKLNRMDEAKAMFEQALQVYPDSNYCKYKIKCIDNPEMLKEPAPQDKRRDTMLKSHDGGADAADNAAEKPNGDAKKSE